MNKFTNPEFGTTVGGLAVLMSLVVTPLKCSEGIPPFVDPADLFVVTTVAQYILTVQENSAHISLRIKSNYEETLQAVALMEGSVEITFKRNPQFKRTLPVSTADLFTSGKYDAASKTLTINPGDVLRFDVVWDFRDDLGLFLPEALFRYSADSTCGYARCIADEEEFLLVGYMQLFDRVARVKGQEASFSFCHFNRYVDGCIPPGSFPCSPTRSQNFPPCTPIL